MTHEEARDAMPLIVVDAEDASTRSAVLAHVAECEACRQALAEYQAAADALARSLPEIRPRPELRAKTLAAILKQPQPVAPDRPAPAETHAVQAPSRTAAPPAAHPTRAAWPQWLATAAALVAALSLGGLLFTRSELMSTRSELSAMRDQLAEWQTRVADAERNAASTRTELVTYRRALDVITSQDLLQVSLQGVTPADRAQGKAFISRSLNAVIFSARDLPALPTGRVYQLWAIAGGQPISAGVFEPDPQGRGQIVSELSLAEPPAAIAVTLEPQGGVPSPTGPKILLGTPAN
jgi:hypothetical protein